MLQFNVDLYAAQLHLCMPSVSATMTAVTYMCIGAELFPSSY